MTQLRIGSRGSALALWQARHVASLLASRGISTTIMPMRTSGDRLLQGSLAQSGGKGLFIKEIEDALLKGEVDLAVHSLKDVPAEMTGGLALAAILPREDPRDVLVAAAGSKLADLPLGTRIGTSSLRRQAQLLTRRPDLRMVALRGNVDTRLGKLGDSCDALVLAAAGLIRLGRREAVTEWLGVEQMCPAAGQGALALECRAADGSLWQRLAAFDDAATAAAVHAERAVLRALGAGCQTPIGAYAECSAGLWRLRAVLASADGRRLIRAERRGAASGQSPQALAPEVAADLLRQGAAGILAAAEPAAAMPARDNGPASEEPA